MALSDQEIFDLSKDHTIKVLNDHGYTEESLAVDKVAELVAGFHVWKETRFWHIPPEDETPPEEIQKTLVMRLAAELIKENRVLSKYPKFRFRHNEETKKVERVGVEFEFRPIFSEERDYKAV